MKVALVHDYLREYGGAERVVEALHELWPRAPLYTSFVDWKALGEQGERFKGWDIRTSRIADTWLIRKLHSPLRFLAPLVWSSFDLSGYDVVISSSGWFMCRGVAISQKKPLHICYIHHPPRNLYGYPTGSGVKKDGIVRAYATVVNFFLRHYDFEAAQNVDYFIANSEETKRRVWKFYRRNATVIYPPIGIDPKSQIPNPRQTQNAKRKTQKKDYYLSVGRLTYAKRVDVAIEACNRLKLPLKVVGTGREEARLRAIAGPTIEFVGSIPDEELHRLYAGARALLFCALEEDFGMVPVEAMSHSTPVLAFAQGGVVESVVEGKTGMLVREPTVESLVEAIRKLNTHYTDYTDDKPYQEIRETFGKERFKREMRAFVDKMVSSARIGRKARS